MENIKFRAWHKNLNEYVTHWHHYGPTIVGGVLQSDDHIIEQFTGLHDKNGTEIYEGDIVSTIKPISGVVKIGMVPDMTINCQEYSLDFCGVWADVPHETDVESRCCYDMCEVIGNIHEGTRNHDTATRAAGEE